MSQIVLLTGIILVYLAMNGMTDYVDKQKVWEELHQQKINAYAVDAAKEVERAALADKINIRQEKWDYYLDFGIRKKQPTIIKYAREHGATTPDERKKALEEKKKQRSTATGRPVQQSPNPVPAT